MRILAQAQGWFYIVTGIWPVLSGRSFQAVTGFKTDFWLAQTVGLLLAVSGAVLVRAAQKNRVTPGIILLAPGQAAGLAAGGNFFLPPARPPPEDLVPWVRRRSP